MKHWAVEAFVKFQGESYWKQADFYLDCWKHVAQTGSFTSLINDLCYCKHKIMPELMLKSRLLHQIGSLIMFEFAFRASKKEGANTNKMNRLIFSLSAGGVMSIMVQNETLMSLKYEVHWKGSDLQRWLFGVSGSGSACEWSKQRTMWIDEQFSSSYSRL